MSAGFMVVGVMLLGTLVYRYLNMDSAWKLFPIRPFSGSCSSFSDSRRFVLPCSWRWLNASHQGFANESADE